MKILILTPITIEYNEVKRHLTASSLASIQNHGFTCEKGSFSGLNHEYDIILKETGSKTNNIALASEKAIQQFKPAIVILTGIAGAVKDAGIGDIVIANKMYGYESGKETEKGFVSRPEVINCSFDLVSFAMQVGKAMNWKARSNYSANSQVYCGPIASGEKVIASKRSIVYERLKKFLNDTLALEMEAIGFGKAMLNHPLIKFVNIRGISDLLSNKSETDKDGSQQVAAANAAAFVFEMLYRLDYSSLNTPDIMELKALIKNIVTCIKPQIQKEAGQDVLLAGSTYDQQIFEKVKPLLGDAYDLAVQNPDDEDYYAGLRLRLNAVLGQQEDIAQEMIHLLQKSKEEQPQPKNQIKNSKNVIVNSQIQVRGDFNIGDKK